MIRNASQDENEPTAVREFIILGFPGPPERQTVFFVMFLVIYLLTLAANVTIISLVWMDHLLHTPMYFFLGNFSFLEMVYVSTTVPKMLAIYLSQNNTVLFPACIAQLYFFSVMGVTEGLFLVIMSYDRYLAICCPLHYATIMTLKFCITLVLGCWLVAVLFTAFPLYLVAKLPFCGPNEVDHFLCESTALLNISCSNTTFSETILSIIVSMLVFIAFIFIMVSYTCVIIAIIRMPSTRGKQKAFSTCTSHLTVVLLFFLTVSLMYVRPSGHNPLLNKVAAAFYGIVIPCLNPFIYSLRNKDIKEAMKKVLKRSRG